MVRTIGSAQKTPFLSILSEDQIHEIHRATLDVLEKTGYKILSEEAVDLLKKAGARSIWKTGIGAAHPGGTCRMGAVVDENLETKIKNCFVCDASVVPVPFGIPPTLTVASLARRLSNHILQKG